MALPPVGCLQTGTRDADPACMESRQTDGHGGEETQINRHGGEETDGYTDMEERRQTDTQTWRRGDNRWTDMEDNRYTDEQP